jgi:putative glutamine amidotransferase
VTPAGKSSRPVVGIVSWRQSVTVWGSSMTIFQIDESYIERVSAAGGLPVLVPHVDAVSAAELVQSLDAVLFTGGDDVHPESYGATDDGSTLNASLDADRSEIALARAAAARRLPMLGACRGAQIINVAFGGTLYQEILREDSRHHGPRPTILHEILSLRHAIDIVPDSRLARLVGTQRRQVNTTHHQAIRDVAPGFQVVARAPDGIIEAIESSSENAILAVQWHPEKLAPPTDQELFDDLVRSASARRLSR